jgi:hypothetical protein
VQNPLGGQVGERGGEVEIERSVRCGHRLRG